MKNIKKINLKNLFNNAEKLRKSGNFLEAVKFFKKILVSEPNFTPGLNGIANCYFQLNKLDQAEKYYLICLKYATHNIQILNNLSLLYLRNKFPDKALPILKKSLDARKDQLDVVEKIGYCLIELNLYSEANTFCKKFLKIYPDNNFLISYYQKALFNLGKNVEGLKLLHKQTGFIQFEEDEIKII